MPQKLNKAGKMQDYIPKGNGDASGEYGTSNGTNKNFTTSDKKSSKANVITENKSVVVENKGKKTIKVRDEDVEVVEKMPDGFAVDEVVNKTSPYTPDGYLWISDAETSALKDRQYKLIEKDKWYNRFKEQDNKANVIDNDLSGKSKTKEINDFSKMFDSDDLTITFENDKYKYAKSGIDGLKKNQFLETLGATVSTKKQRENMQSRNDGKWTFNVKDNKTGESKTINLTNDELYSLWNKVKGKGDLLKDGNRYYSPSAKKERQDKWKND